MEWRLERIFMNESTKPHERQLGDYLLKSKLKEDRAKARWLAKQISVGREVIVDELLDFSDSTHQNFLADTRAKAAVDHPWIASVYEAIDTAEICLRATERLAGESLDAMLKRTASLEPLELVRILRAISEANACHESNQRATAAIRLDHIIVDETGGTRLFNLAIAGTRGDDESARDVMHLGRAMLPLVAMHRPGSTRMLTLLAWMRGKERPAPLTWQEIIDLCKEVERQLTIPSDLVLASSKAGSSARDSRKLTWLCLMTLVPILLIGMIAWLLRPNESRVRTDGERMAAVEIPSGDYPAPDGGMLAIAGFRIDAHETTIGDYREFLTTLAVLAESGKQRLYDHPGQPMSKIGHEPDDWDALLAAARARTHWKGMAVSMKSAVIGVDYWDAYAYATWKKARLPTQEEWFAAAHYRTDEPKSIPPGPWRAYFMESCEDRTGAGIYGMAGSLSEWTDSLSKNPANPLGSPQRVMIGGSFLQPSRHALSRDWTADPSLRREDLGFRLVYRSAKED